MYSEETIRGVERVIVLFVLLCVCWPVDSLRAQDQIDQVIAQAESLYALGRFDDLSQLYALPLQEATDDQIVAVLRLMTLFQLQQGAIPEAKLTVIRLLHRKPEYQPDPVDPPTYAALVQEVRDQVLTPGIADRTCLAEIENANTLYLQGSFEEAMQVLTDCLNWRLAYQPEIQYLPEEEFLPGLRLLSLLYLREGDLTHARATIGRLLQLKPEYVPDPVRDPPGYVAMVHLIRDNRAN